MSTKPRHTRPWEQSLGEPPSEPWEPLAGLSDDEPPDGPTAEQEAL